MTGLVSGDLTPEGMSVYLSYAPEAGAGSVNDKSVEGVDNRHTGRGYDIVIEHSGMADGLNVFAGISNIDDETGGNDRSQKVLGFTYAAGPLTVGAQSLRDELGSDVHSFDYYDNMAYGVSFLVNDNLSISYGQHKSERAKDGAANTGKVELKASSIQAAYTMGGATFKIAQSKATNASYSTAVSNDYDVSVVAMSLAF